SFDHASSLGRELTNHTRSRKFGTARGDFDVSKYAVRARSALFESPLAPQPMSPLAAFRRAAAISGVAADWWLDRLRRNLEALPGTVAAVPHGAIEPAARSFAEQLLSANARSLLS